MATIGRRATRVRGPPGSWGRGTAAERQHVLHPRSLAEGRRRGYHRKFTFAVGSLPHASRFIRIGRVRIALVRPRPAPRLRKRADHGGRAGGRRSGRLASTRSGDTLYLELEAAARHRARAAVCPAARREHSTAGPQGYYDGLAIIRSQDNFVVQWVIRTASGTRQGPRQAAVGVHDCDRPELPFTRLPDRDAMRRSRLSGGFPAARTLARPGLARTLLRDGWRGRGNDVESGSGAELYVVTAMRRGSSTATSRW